MYYQHLNLLVGLSLVVGSYTQTLSTLAPPFTSPFPPPPVIANATTINATIFWTCPALPTQYINITQYVPIVNTTTETRIVPPITIYQTIISTQLVTLTEVLTETSITISQTTATETDTSIVIVPTTATETTVTVSQTTATETDTSIVIVPTTATETSTTVSPVTATATQELLLSTVTQRVTSVTLCPTRLVNTAYTAALPYPTDWTWGCPPGWLCKPTRENCNWEVGLPDRDFLCPPNHCIPAEALPVPLPTWDQTIYGNSTPAEPAGLSVQGIDSYFNMNPEEFGLSYEVFVIEETITLTSTTVRPPSPTVGARQAQTSVPGTCFPWCNNCLLEAQANGKTPALCVPGSAFEVSLEQCEQCIEVHRTDESGGFVQIAPQFQQFLDYCDQFSTIVVTTSVTTTMTDSAGSTMSTVSSILATTVTPRSSTTPIPSGPRTSTTVVATTETVATRLSTWYSDSTITGNDWDQATIILPLQNNSTTTIYGAALSDGVTLVLPIPQTTSAYTTTITGNVPPSTSAPSTRLSGTVAQAASSTTGGGSPSQFTGGASSSRSLTQSLDVRWLALFWSGLALLTADVV